MTSLSYWRTRGFLPIEQREFARLPIVTIRQVDYIKQMINERVAIRNQAIQGGATRSQFIQMVIKDYQDKGLGVIDTKSVWQLYRLRRKAIINSGGQPSPGFAPTRSHHSRKEITAKEIKGQADQLAKQRNIDREVGW